MLNADLPWHNSETPADVNNDAAISPVDLLVIVNTLNGATAAGDSVYLDVNNDGQFSMDDYYAELAAFTAPTTTTETTMSSPTGPSGPTGPDPPLEDPSTSGPTGPSGPSGPGNSPPYVDGGQYTVAHGSSVSSNVYAYDIDGDSLTFALTSNAANGTLVFNGDGSFTYTPDINYSGPDSFSFSASDGINPAVTATVSFDVTNDPPMAYDFSLATIHDQSISSSASGYDMDGDSLTYSVISGPTSGSLGAASMDPSTGAFTYTPNPGYVGSDSIVYEVSDGLDAATATIAIDVTNDPPIAYDGSVTGAPGEIITGNVGGYDMDGDTLTYSLVTGPALGSLGAAGIDPSTGAFTYEPTTAFVGADSFVFQVFDGIATATATILLNFLQFETEPTVNVRLVSNFQGFKYANQFNPEVKDGSLEGNPVVFEVSITLPAGMNALPNAVTVNVKTTDGEAISVAPPPPIAGVPDFTAVNTTLTFPAGAAGAMLAQTVSVATLADTDVEDNEKFTLNIANAMGAVIGTSSATGVIANNDVMITMPAEVSAVEKSLIGGVAVNYQIVGIKTARENGLVVHLVGNTQPGQAVLANGQTPATAAVDYVAVVNKSDKPSYNSIAKEFAFITFRDDNAKEPDEYFWFTYVTGPDNSANVQVTFAGAAIIKVVINNDD